MPSVARERAIASGHAGEAAADERHVRGLDGDVGPRADRDAEVRLGQRRGVVDAVADHRDDFAARLQLADLRRLVGREHFGEELGDADARRHGRGGVAPIAREHRDLQPPLPEPPDRVLRRRPFPGPPPRGRPAACRRTPRAGASCPPRQSARRRLPPADRSIPCASEKGRAADGGAAAPDRAGDAEARLRRPRLDGRRHDALLPRRLHDRPGERMRRALLERRGDAEQVLARTRRRRGRDRSGGAGPP